MVLEESVFVVARLICGPLGKTHDATQTPAVLKIAPLRVALPALRTRIAVAPLGWVTDSYWAAQLIGLPNVGS